MIFGRIGLYGNGTVTSRRCSPRQTVFVPFLSFLLFSISLSPLLFLWLRAALCSLFVLSVSACALYVSTCSLCLHVLSMSACALCVCVCSLCLHVLCLHVLSMSACTLCDWMCSLCLHVLFVLHVLSVCLHVLSMFASALYLRLNVLFISACALRISLRLRTGVTLVINKG